MMQGVGSNTSMINMTAVVYGVDSLTWNIFF